MMTFVRWKNYLGLFLHPVEWIVHFRGDVVIRTPRSVVTGRMRIQKRVGVDVLGLLQWSR
jgi:hypothetical protein